MEKLRHFILWIFFVFLSKIAFSQLQQKDSNFYRQAIDSFESFYSRESGANLLLYNGVEYIPSPFSTKGNPFFETDSDKGSVFYNGKLYRSITLQYDLAKDELVAQYSTNDLPIVLRRDKVTYFLIGGHKFVYISAGKLGNMAAGFYETLTGKTIELLAKHEKKFRLSADAADNSSSYIAYDHYFLKKGDDYYIVTGEASLLSLLKDE